MSLLHGLHLSKETNNWKNRFIEPEETKYLAKSQ